MKRIREVMQDGSRSLILFAVGRKYAHAVAMGDVISLVQIDLGRRPRGGDGRLVNDGLYLPDLRPATWKDAPYPFRRAVRTYLRSGLRKTEKAAKILRQLLRKEPE